MVRKFGPFDTSQFYEVENRRMQRAFNPATGFVKAGQGAVTAGTGAELVIAAYPDGALIDGLYVENPEAETVTLTTNSGNTNPRIDRLVMRLDMGAKTIAPYQIVGTPAASPSAPPLVKTSTVFDMPLCRYTMPGSASAQNPGSIVDERVTIIRASAPDPVAVQMGDGWAARAGNVPVGFFDRSGFVSLAGEFRNNNPFTPGVNQVPFAIPNTLAPAKPEVFTIPYVLVAGPMGQVVVTVLPNGQFRLDNNNNQQIPANTSFFIDAVRYHPTYTGTGA